MIPQQLSKINNIPTSMPFVREPTENFHETDNGLQSEEVVLPKSTTSSVLKELYSLHESDSKDVDYNESCNFNPTLLLFQNFSPNLSEIEGIEDIERRDDRLSLYLWQRSSFYDKAKIDINAWQLRWFTFSHNKIVSLPRRREEVDDEDDICILPLITNFDMDQSRLLIKIETGCRECEFIIIIFS